MLSNHTPLTMPVHVIHGRRAGPNLFVSAAIHGDEILGVEVIRRLLGMPAVARVRGTLMLIPIVNIYGFLAHSRYLPDRRDLNRSFPGSARGSLASQLAHVFMTEIVARADLGIDLHTGAVHRTNLPQIRGDLSIRSVREVARAFRTPLILHSNIRDGSLRQAAQDAGKDLLIYEAGEALRFDETAVRFGVKGVLGVMRHLDMIPERAFRPSRRAPVFASSSHWLRAPASGMFRARRGLGDAVDEDEVIGIVSDPFGEKEVELRARAAGVILGRSNLPVVNQGDALVHVGRVFDPSRAQDAMEQHEAHVERDPLFDEEEIV
jgi:predicted deacylase